MSNKRYKLLQDYKTPTHTIHAGVIKDMNNWHNIFPELLGKEPSEIFDWFEEVKPDRIVAKFIRCNIGGSDKISSCPYEHTFSTDDNPIVTEKFPLIKSVIERVLNGDDKSECVICGFKIKAGAMYCEDHWRHYSPLKYSQEQYDKAERAAFDAAKCGIKVPRQFGEGCFFVNDISPVQTYEEYKSHPHYQDYLNHINKQKQ